MLFFYCKTNVFPVLSSKFQAFIIPFSILPSFSKIDTCLDCTIFVFLVFEQNVEPFDPASILSLFRLTSVNSKTITTLRCYLIMNFYESLMIKQLSVMIFLLFIEKIFQGLLYSLLVFPIYSQRVCQVLFDLSEIQSFSILIFTKTIYFYRFRAHIRVSLLILQSQQKQLFCVNQSLIFQQLAMQRNTEKGRIKLKIDIPKSDSKIDISNEQEEKTFVKPIYSCKNTRKNIVKFNFDDDKIGTARQRKSKRLQGEKDQLLKSINVLKIGAISAIAQKQQQIDNMRSLMVCDEMRQLEEQVEQLIQQRKELTQYIEELQEKLRSQRQSYTRLLEEKDRVIEQLYVELDSTQIQIEKLQNFQEMKEKKIKIIQQQNNYLFHQLQEQKIAHIKQVYLISENHINLPIITPFEPLQTIPEIQTPSNMSKALIEDNQNLTLLESRHRQQMNELTFFYDKRLSEMRQIYEKQLQLWPNERSKQNSDKNQLMEDVVSLKPTVVPIANKLSNELNTKLLSECYSMTKRDVSKCDKQSIQASDRDLIGYNFNNTKRVTNTPASQTTSSHKVEDGLKIMVTKRKKRQSTQVSDDRKSRKSQKIISNGVKEKGKSSVTTFVLGAISGSAVTFLVNNFFRK